MNLVSKPRIILTLRELNQRYSFIFRSGSCLQSTRHYRNRSYDNSRYWEIYSCRYFQWMSTRQLPLLWARLSSERYGGSSTVRGSTPYPFSCDPWSCIWSRINQLYEGQPAIYIVQLKFLLIFCYILSYHPVVSLVFNTLLLSLLISSLTKTKMVETRFLTSSSSSKDTCWFVCYSCLNRGDLLSADVPFVVGSVGWKFLVSSTTWSNITSIPSHVSFPIGISQCGLTWNANQAEIECYSSFHGRSKRILTFHIRWQFQYIDIFCRSILFNPISCSSSCCSKHICCSSNSIFCLPISENAISCSVCQNFLKIIHNQQKCIDPTLNCRSLLFSFFSEPFNKCRGFKRFITYTSENDNFWFYAHESRHAVTVSFEPFFLIKFKIPAMMFFLYKP